MKILIAEDDTFFQKFYSVQLAEKGYQIDVAKDGVEAIEKLKSFQPDVMLLDIIMPNKDGFDVLEAMADDPSIKTSVVVFSTLGQEEDVKRAMNLGAKGYVNKSFFDLDGLLKKLNELS
ncbi:response regulator [Candidatus Woesebacteria bacterium]|nr:response regulator [Candidatus Woesebacteria bacterium]